MWCGRTCGSGTGRTGPGESLEVYGIAGRSGQQAGTQDVGLVWVLRRVCRRKGQKGSPD